MRPAVTQWGSVFTGLGVLTWTHYTVLLCHSVCYITGKQRTGLSAYCPTPRLLFTSSSCSHTHTHTRSRQVSSSWTGSSRAMARTCDPWTSVLDVFVCGCVFVYTCWCVWQIEVSLFPAHPLWIKTQIENEPLFSRCYTDTHTHKQTLWG